MLNKIDRLIVELQFSPAEAYQHLRKILEQVNLITGALFAAQLAEDEHDKVESTETRDSAEAEFDLEDGEFDWTVEDKDDDAVYFDPTRGNVIFTAALDGWGFGLGHFAEILAKKFKCRPQALQRVLWGDFYIAKGANGRPQIRKAAAAKGKSPLFVTAVLSTVWEIYKAVQTTPRDKPRIAKVVTRN